MSQTPLVSGKRTLTEAEIKGLVSFIQSLPGIPEAIGKSVAQRQRNDSARQLREVKIHPAAIPRLKEQLIISHHRAQIDPGKSVGALASTSIGEKNTQNSLSSFHTAGQQKVNLLVGVPRLQEIVNVSREIKTPSMEIWLAYPPERLADLSFIRFRALQILEYHEINDFLLDYDLIENRELEACDESWYELHRTFVGTDYSQCAWSVRLRFDPTLLYAKRMRLSAIVDAIHANYGDAFCVASPDNIGVIDVYIQTDNLGDVENVVESVKATRRKGKKKREPEEDADLALLITDENKERYFLRDLVLPSLRYLPVSGIERVKQCFFQEKGGQWYITTKGSNLRAVLAHPEVDPIRTVTNHLWDTFECLGIEATRFFLRRELDKLISVSHRHIDLLINSMTYSGRPMPASSRGIDIRQVGLLAKIGFEQPWEFLFRAALVAEHDNMRGASSAIIAGNVPLLGSGTPQLLNDKPKRKILEAEVATRTGAGREERAQWETELAQSDLVIDEDRIAYTHSQRMLQLAVPRAPLPASRTPRPVSHGIDSPAQEVRLVSRVAPGGSRPARKSNINAFIEPGPFTPQVPRRAPSVQTPVSLVTRLVVRPKAQLDPTSKRELRRLAPVPSDVLGPIREASKESEEQELY